MAPPHFPKWCLLQSGPGAVNDSNPKLRHQLSARSSEGEGLGASTVVMAPRQVCPWGRASLEIQGQPPAPQHPPKALTGQAFEAA